MSKARRTLIFALAGLMLLAVLISQIPPVKAAIAWRVEKWQLYAQNVANPPGAVPTALPVTARPATALPTETVQAPSPVAAVSPTASSLPLPAQVSLPSPAWEKQTPNNCGPAALSMALHMYGWEGDQGDIAEQIKPETRDRNVNPEELIYFVRNNVGWLNFETRVGGSLELLKKLLAARYPVMIEGTTELDPNDALGPNDDLWAAHYLLITGYDDSTSSFIVQDTYHGPDRTVTYQQLEEQWKPFNYVYMFFYLPSEQPEISSLLGSDWDANANRQLALERAQAATALDPNDAFAWFNVGSNLVYFERYEEASLAYDRAREIGLPMRMFRYQFGPFIAYFQSNRIDDLLVLTDYARGVTEWSEETWLWYGWGLYRKNDFPGALAAWNKALSINPKYGDAEYAIKYLNGQ